MSKAARQQTNDLRDLLWPIRVRPQAFHHSLGDIEVLIDGYVSALAIHRIDEFGTNFSFRFRDFVMARLNVTESRPWSDLLEERYPNAEEARRQFFALLDDFEVQVIAAVLP